MDLLHTKVLKKLHSSLLDSLSVGTDLLARLISEEIIDEEDKKRIQRTEAGQERDRRGKAEELLRLLPCCGSTAFDVFYLSLAESDVRCNQELADKLDKTKEGIAAIPPLHSSISNPTSSFSSRRNASRRLSRSADSGRGIAESSEGIDAHYRYRQLSRSPTCTPPSSAYPFSGSTDSLGMPHRPNQCTSPGRKSPLPPNDRTFDEHLDHMTSIMQGLSAPERVQLLQIGRQMSAARGASDVESEATTDARSFDVPVRRRERKASNPGAQTRRYSEPQSQLHGVNKHGSAARPIPTTSNDQVVARKISRGLTHQRSGSQLRHSSTDQHGHGDVFRDPCPSLQKEIDDIVSILDNQANAQNKTVRTVGIGSSKDRGMQEEPLKRVMLEATCIVAIDEDFQKDAEGDASSLVAGYLRERGIIDAQSNVKCLADTASTLTMTLSDQPFPKPGTTDECTMLVQVTVEANMDDHYYRVAQNAIVRCLKSYLNTQHVYVRSAVRGSTVLLLEMCATALCDLYRLALTVPALLIGIGFSEMVGLGRSTVIRFHWPTSSPALSPTDMHSERLRTASLVGKFPDLDEDDRARILEQVTYPLALALCAKLSLAEVIDCAMLRNVAEKCLPCDPQHAALVSRHRVKPHVMYTKTFTKDSSRVGHLRRNAVSSSINMMRPHSAPSSPPTSRQRKHAFSVSAAEECQQIRRAAVAKAAGQAQRKRSKTVSSAALDK
eukprot:scpid46389/ scgid28841/ 